MLSVAVDAEAQAAAVRETAGASAGNRTGCRVFGMEGDGEDAAGLCVARLLRWRIFAAAVRCL